MLKMLCNFKFIKYFVFFFVSRFIIFRQKRKQYSCHSRQVVIKLFTFFSRSIWKTEFRKTIDLRLTERELPGHALPRKTGGVGPVVGQRCFDSQFCRAGREPGHVLGDARERARVFGENFSDYQRGDVVFVVEYLESNAGLANNIFTKRFTRFIRNSRSPGSPGTV